MANCETRICVQGKIGSCGTGCSIASRVLEQVRGNRDKEVLASIAEKTVKDECPEGCLVAPLLMLLTQENPEQSAW